MRPLLVPLLLAFTVAFAGCTSDGGGSGGSGGGGSQGGPEEGLAAPVSVFDRTIDFAQDPSGVEKAEQLEIPAGARFVTMTVEWRGTAPLASTREVVLEVRDSAGNVLADCSRGTNGVTNSASECGPVMNNVREGETYSLVWSGFGTLEAAVRIVAE